MKLDLAITENAVATEDGSGVFPGPPRLFKADQFELTIVKDLDALRDVWLAFEETAACTPFQSYHWMQVWRDATRGRRAITPLIVLGHRDESLAFILPFALQRRHGGRCLVWLGHELADYNGPLVDPEVLGRLPEDFAAKILARVRNLVPGIDHVFLSKQPETLFGLPNPFASCCAVPFTCAAHSAQLGDNWEEFSLSHRSSRSLRRLREKERKLARLGELTYEAVTSPVERHQLMDRLLAWKVAQLRARGERVPFAEASPRRFMRTLARVTADDPRYRLYAMKSDGRAVALAFCLVSHGRLIYYLCAYEEGEAARFSPGVQLLIHIFKQAIDEGLEVFDFSNGDEDYKAQWVDRSDAIFVTIKPFTLIGRVASALERLELETVRRVKRNLPLRTTANALLKRWWALRRGSTAKQAADDAEPLESNGA